MHNGQCSLSPTPEGLQSHHPYTDLFISGLGSRCTTENALQDPVDFQLLHPWPGHIGASRATAEDLGRGRNEIQSLLVQSLKQVCAYVEELGEVDLEMGLLDRYYGQHYGPSKIEVVFWRRFRRPEALHTESLMPEQEVLACLVRLVQLHSSERWRSEADVAMEADHTPVHPLQLPRTTAVESSVLLLEATTSRTPTNTAAQILLLPPQGPFRKLQLAHPLSHCTSSYSNFMFVRRRRQPIIDGPRHPLLS